MLKGSLDIEIEFMGGTIIFVALSLILMTSLLLPLVAVSYTSGSTNNDIKAIKFANIVKHTLESEFTGIYGGMEIDLLQNFSGSSLSIFGLGNNYASVRDLSTDSEWEFRGNGGKLSHRTFSSVSSYHVTKDSGNLMESGKAYVLDIYTVGRNTVVDIYREPSCSFLGPVTVGGLMRLGCGDFIGLVPETLEASSIRDEITAVKNGAETRTTKLIIADDDMTADDIKPQGTSVTEDCLEGRNDVCFRIIERYRHPAEISVEIGKDSPFVFGGGGEFGGGGVG